MSSLESSFHPESRPLFLSEEGRDLMAKVACIVLAGGQGERLFPLTQTRCKPAVTFGGRYCLIDIPLSHAINAKIPSIFVISQYLVDSLHQHIAHTYAQEVMRGSQLHLLSPEETPQERVWYQGTADAIRQNRLHFQNSSADYFLILSGDQLYNMDLHKLVQFAIQSDADLTVAALPVDKKETSRMGLLKINEQGAVRDFIEKPTDPELLKGFLLSGSAQYLGSMGIYVFKRKALFSLLGHEGNDFGKDLIPKQLHLGKTIAYVYPGYWEDIGTIGSYYRAHLSLLRGEPCLDMHDEKNPIIAERQDLPASFIESTAMHRVMIGEGSIIQAKEITESVIGLRSQIGKGSVIRRSVILGSSYYRPPEHQSPPLPPRFGIGEGCRLEGVIVDAHSWIGNYVQLVNKKGVENYDGENFYVRDGVIVVPSGAQIPDSFIF